MSYSRIQKASYRISGGGTEYSTCNAGIGEYKSAVEVKGAYFGEE